MKQMTGIKTVAGLALILCSALATARGDPAQAKWKS